MRMSNSTIGVVLNNSSNFIAVISIPVERYGWIFLLAQMEREQWRKFKSG